MTWRDLFDVVIVLARKPEFFSSRSPLFEVVNDEGLLKPARSLAEGGMYAGGNAALVEERLGVNGDQILYVGDHLFADVHVTKNVLRWRTALILRELEEDLAAEEAFTPQREHLQALMRRKEELEIRSCQLRLAIQRAKGSYGPKPPAGVRSLEEELESLRNALQQLDGEIAPLASAAAELSNARWGLLMRAGNDKSHLARQVERYADIYLSRVSNFLSLTPFAYLRSPRGSLPHDPDLRPGVADDEAP
jgi:transposase-like protein